MKSKGSGLAWVVAWLFLFSLTSFKILNDRIDKLQDQLTELIQEQPQERAPKTFSEAPKRPKKLGVVR